MNEVQMLTAEIERAMAYGAFKGTFTTSKGETITAITESDLGNHLTSKRFGMYADGRQYRFPGITNGWVFSSRLREAGFEIIGVKNRRNQTCNVIVKIK